MLQVKIMSDKEFERLPYKNVSTSLGCADKKTNTAYIRQTKFPKVNLLTIEHELEELFLKHSPHEIDGIRYLSFSDFLSGGSSLLGTAAGAYQGYNASKDAGNSTMQNILGGVSGASAGQEFGSNVGNAITKGSSLLSGEGSFTDKLGGLGDILGGVSGGSNIIDQVSQQSRYPGGATAAGLNLPEYPEAPALGETISKWLTSDSVTRAGAKARDIVDTQYYADFEVTPETQALMGVMESDIRKNYKTRKENLDKNALATNEQWMRSGERLETMRRIEEEEEQEVNRMQSEWTVRGQEEHSQKQYNMIVNDLAIDQQTKNDLLYGDMWTLMQNYQLDVKDVEDFRNIAVMSGLYDKVLQNENIDPNQAKQQIKSGATSATGLISSLEAVKGLASGVSKAAGLLGIGGTGATVAGSTLGATTFGGGIASLLGSGASAAGTLGATTFGAGTGALLGSGTAASGLGLAGAGSLSSALPSIAASGTTVAELLGGGAAATAEASTAIAGGGLVALLPLLPFALVAGFMISKQMKAKPEWDYNMTKIVDDVSVILDKDLSGIDPTTVSEDKLQELMTESTTLVTDSMKNKDFNELARLMGTEQGLALIKSYAGANSGTAWLDDPSAKGPVTRQAGQETGFIGYVARHPELAAMLSQEQLAALNGAGTMNWSATKGEQ